LEWDNYTVKYRTARGANRGLVIRYGKNMTDFKQEANCAEVYTGIYPYYYDQSNDNYVELDGCILKAEGTFSFEHYLPVDLTSYFTELDEGETPTKDTELAYGEIPTKAQLLAVAQQYLEDNEIGVPDVSIDINFAQLSQSMEYKDLVLLESCYLCDTVSVSFSQMNVVALAQVVETTFNVLTDKYDNLVLGNAQKDYVTSQRLEQMETLKKVIEAAAQAKKEAQKAANTSAENLAKAVTELNSDIENLQSQVDGNIATWFYAYVPALDNLPASGWTSDNDKNVHLGDLFYNTNTGYAYRFMLSDGTYQWTRIVDTDVTKALADAAAAQDTADNKRRVFYSTPIPPYDKGDLWVQGENGDILRCQTAKATGGAYSASDWVLASKYTDDTTAQEALNAAQDAANTAAKNLANAVTALNKDIDNLQTQIDGNTTNWFYAYAPTTSNVPASDWTDDATKDNHLGDVFYDTSTGYAYRFLKSGTTYSWAKITDKDVTQALADAATAQDTADNKRRVFFSTPTPPYDQGDLWVQGSDGDILRCQVAKAKTGAYSASDWVLASKYTDDTKAEAVEIELNNTINSVKSSLQTQIESATKQITGNLGGYVVLHDSDGDNAPDEILIMDTPTIKENEGHVWRWNKEGLGYSSTGYNGPFGTAITADGKINADYITTGTLDASQINVKNLSANSITSGTLNAIDIVGSNISSGTINVGGLSISSSDYTVYTTGNLEVQGSITSGLTIESGSNINAETYVQAYEGFAISNWNDKGITQDIEYASHVYDDGSYDTGTLHVKYGLITDVDV